MLDAGVVLVGAAVVALLAILLALLLLPRASPDPLADDEAPPALSTYVINLRRNPERLAHFQRSFTASDLGASNSFIRVEAVDGSQIQVEQFVTPYALQEISQAEAVGYRTKHYQLTRGGVGCALSHMEVWRQLLASDRDAALVFEDDVVMHPDIWALFRRALPSIPQDWDILLLGYFCKNCERRQGHFRVRRFFGLHAYVIRRRGAVRAFQYGLLPINQQLDSLLSDAAEEGALNIYTLPVKLARQDSSAFRTEIQMPLRRVAAVRDPWQRAVSAQKNLLSPS